MDTLSIQGRGPPSNPNGLTRSLFRPSDDAATLPYNIPGNAMICVELEHLSNILSQLDSETALELQTRAKEIAVPLCAAVRELSE
jgi:meiotically up-regulated gene 157 (Mug157) protein